MAIPVIPDLGTIIRFHRRQAGLSRRQLAKLAGVGKTVMFDIEKGKESVRLDTLSKVLIALNIQVDWASPLKDAYLEKKEKEVSSGLRD